MACEMNASESSSVLRFPNFRFPGFKLQIRRGSFSWKILTILCCLTGVVSADQLGDFTYTENVASITITRCATTATGAVVVPATIVGKPVTAIANSAFQACTGLTGVTIPVGVTSIGTSAFLGCSGLTSMTIPYGVTSLGTYTFYNCTALQSVSLPSSLISVGIYAFYNCIALESVSLPMGVTTISAQAFYRCKGMTSVTIPSSVTTIGDGAFYSCGALTSVVIPSGVTSIGFGTFESCSVLTSVTIPSTVTSIGQQAFRYCNGLTSVTIPSSVTSIGVSAFFNCKGLTSVAIPASVTNIGTFAYANCSALTSISVDPANPNFSSVNGILANKAQTMLITCPAGVAGDCTIPSGVTGIGNAAFANCSKLVSVTLPVTLASMGNQAFSNCGALMHASFTGDAPTMGSNVFELTATGFAVFYSSTSNGFTSPVWVGYPAFNLGDSGTMVAVWLLSRGLAPMTDLQSDLNGDGVNLLMAYALNLDPYQNLSKAVPQPVFATDQMSLSFYAGALGVTYVVEASTDMVNWSSEGVALSLPDANQIRTAVVNRSGTNTFMRLAVSH